MDIQSTSQASVTLAVLNSTNADEAAHSVPYSFTQSVKHSSSLDHDYLAFQNSKHNHLVIDSHQVDNNAHMQEQVTNLCLHYYSLWLRQIELEVEFPASTSIEGKGTIALPEAAEDDLY